MPLQLSLLGGFDCRSGSGDVLTFPTSKVRALFAYLATNPSRGTDATSWPTFCGATTRRARGGQPAQGALAPASEPAGGRAGLPCRRQNQLAVRPVPWRWMSGCSARRRRHP